MTKAEAAIVMAYTGVSMLRGKDLILYTSYVKAITGVSFTPAEIFILEGDDKRVRRQKRRIQKMIHDRSRGDFLNICQHLNYGYVFLKGRPTGARVIRSIYDDEG